MEKEIKVLEEYIEWIKKEGIEVCAMEKELPAIENLLKGYREYKNFYHRRLKEWRTKFENQEKHFLNELDEYDEEREKLKKQLDNSIPKSKVKELIQKESFGVYIKPNGIIKVIQIEVLQELMEDK